MNPVQAHLLLNHFSLFCVLIGAVILAIGLLRSQQTLKTTGLALFIAAALFIYPTFETGESAEDPIEELGFSHDAIHEHEEQAEAAMVGVFVLGALAVVSLFAQQRKLGFANALVILTFVGSLGVFYLLANTGNSGGKIRRPDLQQVSE